MSLITDVRRITAETVEKIKAKEKEIEDYKAERSHYSDTYYAEGMDKLQSELKEIQSEYMKAVQQHVERYRKDVMAADALDGSKVTDDAKLLSGAFKLTLSDLDGMMERAAGNRTMEKLIYNYAEEHGMGLKLGRPFYTAEQKAAAAEEFLTLYARKVCARPEYYDIWGTDEYFNEATPEEIRGE